MREFLQVLLLVTQLLASLASFSCARCFLVPYMTLAIGSLQHARTIVLRFARALRRAQR